MQDTEGGINKSCVICNLSELASTISRVDRKIITFYIFGSTVESALNSVEMKDLFKCFLNCTNNSKNHYFDFYERARNLDVSLNVEELKRLYDQFLDPDLPKSKKIRNIWLKDRGKRLKIRSYTRSPDPSKVEEVKIILKYIIREVFLESSEVRATSDQLTFFR